MAKQGGLGTAAVLALPLILVGALIAGLLLIFGPAQQAGWCEAARSDLAVLLVRNCPD